MSSSPSNTVNAYNVVYNASNPITTGPELTTSVSTLSNLTNSGSSTITLNNAITINGVLTLSSGTFSAGSNAITLKGNFVDNAGSALTSSTFTFSGATIISGSTAPTFGAIVITAGSSLTPSANFQINGNVTFVGSGTLNAGSATTTFGGTTLITLGSTTPSFNNIIISGSLTAPSGAGSINVAGTFTNNGTFVNNGSIVVFNGTSSIAGSSSTTFGSITISGILNSPTTLNVSRNFVNNGTFNAASGTVMLNGSSVQQISGSVVTNFNNITITNVAGPPAVQIQSNQNLLGVLTLSATSQFDADGTGNSSIFTLKSTDDGADFNNTTTSDASIATLPAGAAVLGSVTVERYMRIEGPGGRIYRYISSAVQNAPVSQIQATIPVTGTFTGHSVCGTCGTNQSMFLYDETIAGLQNVGYTNFPVATNTETLAKGRGYAIFERGDVAPISVAGSALWSVRGVINSGTVTYPVSFTAHNGVPEDGWNLVGNPYPSTIDWNAASGWTKSADIQATIYMTDNAAGTPPSYSTLVATWNGVAGTNGGSRYLPTGQAFFVKSNGGGSPTLISTEAVKVAGTQSIYLRTADLSNLMRVTLIQDDKRDEAIIHFRNDATEDFDGHADAYKLKNTIFNMSTLAQGGTKLAINSLPTLTCTRIVKLDVSDATPGAYHFDFSNLTSFDPSVKILAHDAFAGGDWIDLKAKSGFDFQVTTDSASFGSGRFTLSFGFSDQLPLALNLTAAGACGSGDSKIQIDNSSSKLFYFAKVNGNSITPMTSGNGQSLSLTVANNNLKVGENIVEIVSQSPNCATLTYSQNVKVIVDTLYSASRTTGSSNCLTGSVVLKGAGAPKGGTYNWYARQTDQAALFSGDQFATPVLKKTETYYVAAVNSLGCEGQRVAVDATITNFSPAIISLAEGDPSIFLSNYSHGNQWFLEGQLLSDTTATLKVKSNGRYTLNVKIGSCTASVERTYDVTGVEEVLAGVKGYPNPVEGLYSLEIPDDRNQIVNLPVFNSVGSQVGSMKLTNEGNWKKGQFDFSPHASGFYFIKIVSGSNIKVVKVDQDYSFFHFCGLPWLPLTGKYKLGFCTTREPGF
jgi:Ig-like domain CHU_C associated/Secretion system C-terminal sorting domain